MAEPLNINDFAELGRMIKYIDRHDIDEIIAVQKQEAEVELARAEQNLEKAQEQIVED